MKKYFLILAFLFGISAYSQEIKVYQGDFEVSGSAEYTQSQLGGHFRLGTYVSDYLQVGVEAGILDSDPLSRFALGAYVQYLFETQTYLLPYLGSGLGLSSLDVDGGDSESGIDFKLFTGMKYFLPENLSLNFELYMAFGSADTYIDKDKASDSDYGLTVGLSYCW